VTDAASRTTLVKVARDAITARVTGVRTDSGAVAGALAMRHGGAFVTLHHCGDLRGCIGHIEADQPLVQAVAQCAVSACSADPRFAPVTAEELPDIAIELSLLGPLEEIAAPSDIAVGRHGLLVARGSQRGLLLPQVAIEWNWDAMTFLTQTCRKAGLPADAWQRGATVWRFEAEVFGDLLS
jgi:AmmeMemoRadiSam system protein A